MMAFILTACGGELVSTTYYLPYQTPEDAPDEWKLGWEHGCKSGLSAYGSSYYKALYSFQQDTSMVDNDYYFKAWIEGMNYCRAYINRYLIGYSFGPGDFDVLSSQNLSIKSRDLRDFKDILRSPGFGFLDYGMDTPGWGGNKWGGNVEGSDWLGRAPEDQVDWLGRTAKHR